MSLYFIPAAPIKMKQKLPGSRQGLATIPHITNIDPFPNNTQVSHLSYMFLKIGHSGDSRRISIFEVTPKPKNDNIAWKISFTKILL